jgi:hypothetical protein
MQPTRSKLDLVPLKIAHFGRPQAMPIGDQNHGGVAMAPTARLASRRHQYLDLRRRQILARSGNCGIYDSWCRIVRYP